jgi:hypothetical protein
VNRTAASILLLVALAACSEPLGSPPPPPDPGTMRVHITGGVTEEASWSAFGQFRDILAADTGELSLLGGQSPSITAVRMLTLVFPGRLDNGSFALGRYIYGAVQTEPAAYVIIDTSFFASVPGGTIHVTSAVFPPRPGLDPGVLSGGLLFQAVRLAAGPGGAAVETTDTIRVSASFAAHWYHYLRPNISVSVTGGPVPGASLVTIGQSIDDDHGGRFVDWEADFDRVAGQGIPYEVSQEFRLLAPGVGTYPMAPLTPSKFANPAQWPAAFTALYYRDDPRIALSAGGTLTITSFAAPTDAYFGEIQGTLDAPLALWADDTTVTADTAHVTARFAVQLWPLGGIPATPKP